MNKGAMLIALLTMIAVNLSTDNMTVRLLTHVPAVIYLTYRLNKLHQLETSL